MHLRFFVFFLVIDAVHIFVCVYYQPRLLSRLKFSDFFVLHSVAKFWRHMDKLREQELPPTQTLATQWLDTWDPPTLAVKSNSWTYQS